MSMPTDGLTEVKRTGWQLLRDRQAQTGQDRPDQERVDVHSARLAPNSPGGQRISYGLLAVVQVARAARRQAHSSLLSRLEDAKGCGPEGREEREAQPPIGTVDL